jgi:hypothetical protein
LEIHGDLREARIRIARPREGLHAVVSGRLGRAEIFREKREEPITGTAISLAKGDMQVKHNYKTPHHGWIAFLVRTA